MDTVKIGIIGTGWIAEKMAITLEGMEGVEAYAVSSRQLQTARDFADRWGFTRAYGSYEEMLDDEEVELVYVATPHSHHFEHARMSLLKGKAVLCECPSGGRTAESCQRKGTLHHRSYLDTLHAPIANHQ